MRTLNPPSSASGYLWRAAVIALAYFAGSQLSGMLIGSIGLPWPDAPTDAPLELRLLLDLASSVLLATCLVPLAAGLSGSTARRWLILAAFFYVSYGVNNQIEGATYSTIGGATTMVFFYVIPCVLAAGAAVTLVPATEPAAALATVFGGRTVSSWWWRMLLAWLSFPVIFFIFGAMAFPLVSSTYQQPESALVVPGPGTVLRTVFIRSAFFLVVTVPVITAWARSRRSLILSLAFAFFVMVGLAGLVSAHWLPVGMRSVHAVEILADSLVYAWVLAKLLVPRTSPQPVVGSSPPES